jgi:D-tyrosyl-tRNA(Tyr) deacylase
MRVVIQRVTQASVEVDQTTVGEIGPGLVVLLGIANWDEREDADRLVERIINLRIFPDDQEGKMNLSVRDIGGSLLIISQFTLYGDCRRGRRPSFDQAAGPEQARELYEYFVKKVKTSGLTVHTGVFQAKMQVALTNDGPVTLIIDSRVIEKLQGT